MPDTMKKIALLALATAFVTGLSGCGRKGDLEAPGAYESQKTTDSGDKKPTNDKPFILDPLL
jgi:predicted small lipoprotein YifL